MPLKLRTANQADIPLLNSLSARSLVFRQITVDTFQSMDFVIAEMHETPVAAIGTQQNNPEILEICFLGQTETARRTNVEKLLITRIEDRARSSNIEHLETTIRAKFLHHFEANGFKLIKNFTQNEDQFCRVEKRLEPEVYSIKHLNIQLSTTPLNFEEANKQEIAAHFENVKKRLPSVWNGRTLKLTSFTFEDGTFEGICQECSFAAFLAWRDWGAPDLNLHNLFGSAVLVSSDGALLYGQMGDHTATAGLIYPPGGNLDPSDVLPSNKIDVVGSIYRELEEETGLKPNSVQAEELLLVFDGPRISVSQVFKLDQKAEAIRQSVLRYLETAEEQELSDILIIRDKKDLCNPKIVPYARALGRHLFSKEPPH